MNQQLPRRRSGKRSNTPDPPTHFESTSTVHARPMRQRPAPPANAARLPEPVSPSPAQRAAAQQAPATVQAGVWLGLTRFERWLVRALIAILVLDIGAVILAHLVGRVLYLLCVIRYGPGYTYPW